MNWTDPLFLSSGLSGLSLLIAAIIMRRFPPKNINDLYGYRSARSRASQGAWDFSQKYSSDLMIWVGTYNLLVGSAGLFVSLDSLMAVGISVVFLILSCVYLFWKTEKELKARFSE